MRRGRLAVCAPVALAVVLWTGATAAPSLAGQVATARAVGRLAASRPGVSAEIKIRPGPTPPRGKPEFVAHFSGKRLNTKVWDTCYPFASQTGCTNFGNPEEREWYVPGQVRVYNGILHLVAARKKIKGTAKSGKPKEYYCRSGMVTSHPGLRFKYGFLQITARIPHSLGLWPALWMVPANETSLPEIDILESWGLDRAGSFFHPYPAGSRHDRAAIPVSWTRGWQTYTLDWTPSRLSFYTGKALIMTVTKKVPHSAMYFIADLAEYLPVAKGYCAGQLEIHSVKLWKN
jgi:beta-glucanase (GH16 family)